MAWPQLDSPCLLEPISILIQLGFLGLLLLLFIRKCLDQVRNWETKITDQARDKCLTGVKFNSSYKAGFACSALQLGVHIAVLLMLLHSDHETNCNSKIQALSAEILQVISWAITVIAVYMIFPMDGYIKLHWILRAWWLCSFMLSILYTSLDISLPNSHT